jgi:hypothetical protein
VLGRAGPCWAVLGRAVLNQEMLLNHLKMSYLFFRSDNFEIERSNINLNNIF